MQAVILAGGKGTRLKPFTTTIPKPLMPLGDTPIIEIVIRQLKRDGFEDIVVAVNHLKELVTAVLGNGEKWGVKITYSSEGEKFLGTAGPLKIIESMEDNFLVVNGDTLTTLDYGKLFEYHCDNGAQSTIAVSKRELKIDFGVIKRTNEGYLSDFTEKPTYSFEVSMGVNVFSRNVLKYIREGEKMDLPDLLWKLKDVGQKIFVYPFDGIWLDIGHIEDYETANETFEKERSKFLKGCA